MPIPGGDMKVCKNTFVGTLQIDSARIHRALLKVQSPTTRDSRGKHVPHNRIPSTTVGLIRTHIKSFPTIPSHYPRSQTNIKYLGTNLNLSLMYRLFVGHVKEKSLLEKMPRQSMYEKVFRRDFHLRFKPPRKDTCQTCDMQNIQMEAAESEHRSRSTPHIKNETINLPPQSSTCKTEY
ncbi:hypothetical protein PR048_021853 [Dryococelus australis]|uniref:Uncharacterized protein n=1 Tax=Dryococelus australis TaxID=614101 RepID=A0ABQ9GZC5_9NEOP|nr:hypothetical protein PR048_021853 [Dryococelus australis]